MDNPQHQNNVLQKKIKNLTDKIREADDTLDVVYKQLKEAKINIDDLNKANSKLETKIKDEQNKNLTLEQQIYEQQLKTVENIKENITIKKDNHFEHKNNILIEEQALLLDNINRLTNEVSSLKKIIDNYEENAQHQSNLKETPSSSLSDKLNIDFETELKFTVFQTTIDKLQIENLKLRDVIEEFETNYFYTSTKSSGGLCCCIC